jgi:tetratricopeptide (TPR) repeat protein
MIYLLADFVPSRLLHTEGFRDFSCRLLDQALDCREKGEWERAEQTASNARDSSREKRAHAEQAAALIHLADIYRERGRLGPALRHAQEAHEILNRQASLTQRHNEAVAAYNLGLIHHLLGNDGDALNWYQTAQRGFEEARKRWATRKETGWVRTCIVMEEWIRNLSESLTRVEDRDGLLSTFIIPAQLVEGHNGNLGTAELRVNGYRLGRQLEIGDRTFQVRPVKRSGVILQPEDDYRIFEIPADVCLQIGAKKGDCVLAERRDKEDPKAPYCVVEGGAGPDFGRFRRNSSGAVEFYSVTTKRVIGGVSGSDFPIYYPVARLEPK